MASQQANQKKAARTAASGTKQKPNPPEPKYCECGNELTKHLDGSRGRVSVAHTCGKCGRTYGKMKPTRFGMG